VLEAGQVHLAAAPLLADGSVVWVAAVP